jgi:hypothetical protein
VKGGEGTLSTCHTKSFPANRSGIATVASLHVNLRTSRFLSSSEATTSSVEARGTPFPNITCHYVEGS